MLNVSENTRCATPEATYEAGMSLGRELRAGDAVLLSGGLGAGKTLFTKGMMDALGFDPDEVTSPSFSLVNLYRTSKFDVYHIDLWRVPDAADAAAAVDLAEIADDERSVIVVEWAERLGPFPFRGSILQVAIEGDGDDPRSISIIRRSGAA